ncbi:hypothetical protein OIU76_008544, partial [Salix suchowensis]
MLKLLIHQFAISGILPLLLLEALPLPLKLLINPCLFVEDGWIKSSNLATVGVGVIQVIATGITTWLVDKTGRRLLLIVSTSGMTISLLIVAVSFFVKGFASD